MRRPARSPSRVFGTFDNSLDVDGIFSIPARFLPGGALPAAPGTVLPVNTVVFFESGAARRWSWTDLSPGQPGSNRFETTATGSRLILDDTARILTIDFGPNFNGNTNALGGSVTAGPFEPNGGTITGGTASVIPVPTPLLLFPIALAALFGAGRLRRRSA